MKRKFITKVISVTMISAILYTLVPIKASAEWRNDYQGNWYYMQNDKKLTGWAKIDGQLYYFDDNGKMQTGWIKAGNSWYFLKSSGALETGWIEYSGNLYYTDSSGVMQTGIIEIEGKIYILNDNGVVKTQNTIINGQFYTIGSDGEVAGNVVPTPNKEFDAYGKCINTLNNTDSSTTASPISSNFDDVIEDQSDSYVVDSSIKYNVEYIDSSNGDVLETKKVRINKHIDLYEPTKDGYKFKEWNARIDGSGKSYDEGDSVKITKDLTLYAQWTLYVTSISINGNSSVALNSTAQMTATVSPSNAGDTSVTWSVTAGTGSATITSNGVLTGISSGTVTVTATANDGSGVSATKQVTVK